MPRNARKPTASARSTQSARSSSKELRARAVAQLLSDSSVLAGRSVEELKPIIQELQVHQVELELQNEELRHAQVQLAHTRDEFSDIYEFSPVGFLTLSTTGLIQQASRFAATLLGVDIEKLIGAPFSRFVAPSSQDAFFLHSRELVAPNESKTVEIEVGHGSTGPWRRVRMHSHVRLDTPGGAPAWRTTLIDVSEYRKVEEELRHLGDDLERRVAERTAALERSVIAARERQSHLGGIVDASMDAIVSVDDRQRIILFNAAAEQMFGWTASRIIGKPLDLLIPQVNRKAHTEQLRKFDPSGLKARRIDPLQPLEGRRADGTEFPIEAAVSHATIDGREIFTVILRDISRRIRAMEAMLENENALMDFFTAAPLGLMWVRPDGSVERVNQAQLTLLDRTSEEVIAQPIAGFHTDRESIDSILAQLAKRQTVQNQRARLIRKDGTTRHVLIDANGLWKAGKLVHSRWFVRDITRRLDLEREILAIAEGERERVGHELHDDLCQELLGIEFKTERMARRWEATCPGAAQDYRRLSTSLQRAIAHTRELARGLSPTSTLLDRGLTEALQDLAARTQKVFHRKCRFRCAAPVAISDPAVAIHLYRIAQEAVSNAIRHGKASKIDIQLVAREHDLVLGVRDNGGGIPVEPRKSKGMGLRIMQYRAGVINGSLAVQREAKGGTSVVCTVHGALRPSSAPRQSQV